jgi:hypothetical protein
MEKGRHYRGYKPKYPSSNDDEATQAYSGLNTVWTLLPRDAGNDLISVPVTEGSAVPSL